MLGLLCSPNESSRLGDIEVRGQDRVNCGQEIAKELGTERVVLLCCHKVGEGIQYWRGDVGKVQGETEGVEDWGKSGLRDRASATTLSLPLMWTMQVKSYCASISCHLASQGDRDSVGCVMMYLRLSWSVWISMGTPVR